MGIDSTSGQVYVLDLTGMGGQTVTTHVKATDINGLSATAELQASLCLPDCLYQSTADVNWLSLITLARGLGDWSVHFS